MGTKRKRIVIIGGGFAGSYAVRKLQHAGAVTLIDTKSYFEFTPSVLRTIADISHLEKIQVSHTTYLQHAEFVQGAVTRITNKDVAIGSRRIAFDYLIIASGSQYAAPIKEENMVLGMRGEELKEYAGKVKAAERILIVGGGLVGVELAAEIIEAYPKKKVTIINASASLIERCNKKAIAAAERFFKQRNVELIMGERMIGATGRRFKTSKGTIRKADLCFLCTGIKPNSSFMPKEHLDSRGFVNVNDKLQVHGQQHMFAVGDVNAIHEEKTAQNAEQQAKVAAKNIIHMETGKRLLPYQSKARVMVMSLGKKEGILTYKNMAIGGRIPAMLKEFIEWREMGKLRTDH
ncbi:FAD-dependent oxidoreductase [Candidatus Woesearchaeota archaeon]|nr:FAD-dependent oxidoreductase [Candidatus Woesearchaeota archaeon]